MQRQSETKQCKCGNNRFTASQRCYHDVIVNELGIFEKDIEIFESERPYGPFRCTKCGASYEALDELEITEENENEKSEEQFCNNGENEQKST